VRCSRCKEIAELNCQIANKFLRIVSVAMNLRKPKLDWINKVLADAEEGLGSVLLKRRLEFSTDLEQRKAIVDQLMTNPDSRGGV
jgi:hypothetical protein